MRLLRLLRGDPVPPACPCCYYTYSAGWPPLCGWYVGAWAHYCNSFTWTWSDHQAPHQRPWVVPACQILNTRYAWLFPEITDPADRGVPWEEYSDRVEQSLAPADGGAGADGPPPAPEADGPPAPEVPEGHEALASGPAVGARGPGPSIAQDMIGPLIALDIINEDMVTMETKDTDKVVDDTGRRVLPPGALHRRNKIGAATSSSAEPVEPEELEEC